MNIKRAWITLIRESKSLFKGQQVRGSVMTPEELGNIESRIKTDIEKIQVDFAERFPEEQRMKINWEHCCSNSIIFNMTNEEVMALNTARFKRNHRS